MDRARVHHLHTLHNCDLPASQSLDFAPKVVDAKILSKKKEIWLQAYLHDGQSESD